jgi:FAD/FMN-containing dehydrogenase
VAPNDYAYDDHKPCQLGGLPRYVLNATDAAQVATAMAWANARDIRVVIKGTGHDLNGR